MIYLDNAATTKMYREAIEKMVEVEENYYANTSSIHSFGMDSENLVKKSKNIMAKAINAKDSEIYFTKGASESNNIAVSSFASADSKVITTSIEHSSIYDAVINNNYKEVIFLKNDKYGFVDLKDLKEKLDQDVKLVSIIYVNNEIGTIQDIREISKLVKSYNPNICMHIDATQAVGKISCDVDKLGVDLMSFSAHKFHGPKGVGILYVRNNILSKIKPVIYGGRQEIVSSGTVNHPAICAAGVALEKQLTANEYKHIEALNQALRKAIEASINDYYIISPKENSSAYVLDVCFKNIKSEVLVHYLEDNGIFVSSGSACSKGEDNRILTALGVDKDYIDGAIRFSFSNETSMDEINETVGVLKEGIEMIREVF
ncbi:MAG: cysteine desulfurase family protein [Peptoniphilaceae bacterium]|nr:cysteine desulfurase family protein [Peptoniphilaceae bacterium]